MLSLIHSSIAESYFKTYQVYPVLGKRIKKEILQKDEDLEYCLFHKYITSSDPRNALEVVNHLGGYWFYNKREGKTLLKKLIEDKEIEKSIKKGIKKEEDIERVVSCVRNIADVSEEVALKLVNAVSARIEKEEDIWKIGWCMKEEIAYVASEEVASKLFDVVSSRMEKEEDIVTIGRLMKKIADEDKEVGLELVNRIGIDVLAAKIEKEKAIWKIGWCIGGIRWASEEVAQEIVNRVNPKLREELQEKGWFK